MNDAPRPGFDGSLISDRSRRLSWLLIEGFRYEVDAEASANIFRADLVSLDAFELVERVPVRGAIRTGSRLVRGGPQAAIHLFAVDSPENRLHRISNWESFLEFGFDMDKVMLAPEALLRTVPTGVDLVGARDRIARRGHSMYLPLLEVLG